MPNTVSFSGDSQSHHGIRYFPLVSGRYEVSPGLSPFPSDLGNGVYDQQVFQIDDQFQHFLSNKMAARRECLEKYYCETGFSPAIAKAVNGFILKRLCEEHPDLFRLESRSEQSVLHCHLTAQRLVFDNSFCLLGSHGAKAPVPVYASAFDALACQIQEDLAVICKTPETEDSICALHLCAPNHWAAEEKIGQGFITTHAPVPLMEKINRQAEPLVHAMLHKGPYVRFAWGLATDNRLNHHPEPPPGMDALSWTGRRFDPKRPQLFLRVERQTIHGFPEVSAALFTIRSHFYDVEQLKKEPAQCAALTSAIASMSEESLLYKGLAADRDAILVWLNS